jgi:hypothetical protein
MFKRYELFGKKTIETKEDIVLVPVHEGMEGQEVYTADRIRYVDLLYKKQRVLQALDDINNKIAEAEKVINGAK